MSIQSRLLKAGSMAESLGLYIPAMVLQKGVALARLLLFTYLLAKVQYGLWGLGMLIFNIAAAVLVLGSNHGLMRYVSFYEARGQLGVFYRRMRWAVIACAVSLAAVALAGSGPITRFLIASRAQAAEVAYRDQLYVCWAALANALAAGLYHSLLGFLIGMRTYRLVSAMEVVFALVFTLFGTVTLMFVPTGLALLLAHLAALGVTLTTGTAMLHLGLRRLGGRAEPAAGQADAFVVPAGGETDGLAGPVALEVGPARADPGAGGMYARVFRYGAGALLGTLLWHAAGYISFWLTNRHHGKAAAGEFYVFLLLGQTILALGNAVWAVIFSHVARLWEARQRPAAILRLETAYKAAAMSLLTLAVLMYVAAPLWVEVLSSSYRTGLKLLGGLLLFFQFVNHLGLMSIMAKLHERPIWIALSALAGVAANLALALWWMPQQGPAGAAWAAGVGMYAGGGSVALIYLLASRSGLHPSSYFVLLLPAVLLLPLSMVGVVWAGVLVVALFTPLVFQPQQKQLLVALLSRARRPRRQKAD